VDQSLQRWDTDASSTFENHVEEFVAFNEKIDQAVKIYDHLLQERLNTSYQRRLTSSTYGHPGMHGGGGPGVYNGQAIPQTPQIGHVYPQITGQDSRYSQYVPAAGTYSGVPGQQTPQLPFQTPYQQPQQLPQVPYQYQPTQPQQPPAAAPYAVATPGPSDQPYSVAQGGQQPVVQNQYYQQPQQQQQSFVPSQPIQQQQQPVSGIAPSIPMDGQPPVSNTYQPVGQLMQPPPQQQQQQQQQPVPQQFSGVSQPAPLQYPSQQPIQQQPTYTVAQPPPQPQVEEAPLIEL